MERPAAPASADPEGGTEPAAGGGLPAPVWIGALILAVLALGALLLS